MNKVKMLFSTLLFALFIGVGSPVSAQDADSRVATEHNDNDDDDGFNYGWLGLIGLVGLLGLKKKDDVHVHDSANQSRVRNQV
ncbi:MAG: WGxxGxxG family protein [Chryseolinea sp.]